MKNIEYKIFNPGGNKTALVKGNEYSTKEKKLINDEILKENNDVEQVGFIDENKRKLEMAGGEFCVNATRCAIWQLLDGKTENIRLRVSGYSEEIEGGIDESKNVFAKMPLNRRLEEILKIDESNNLVELEGITLSVFDEEKSKVYIKNLKEDEEKTKQELKEIMKKYNTNQNAIGIILLEKLRIYPIIWVKTIDTLYYETACGSGSLATAIYKFSKQGLKEFEIIQPSGYAINVNLNIENNYIYEATVLGNIIEGSKPWKSLKY